MQKMVLALDLHNDRNCKKKVMKIVSSVAGIESISLDTNERKRTLIGEMDLMQVVNKLRKTFHAEVVTVGPAKEENESPPAQDNNSTPSNEPLPPSPVITCPTYVPIYNPFYPNYIYYY